MSVVRSLLDRVLESIWYGNNPLRWLLWPAGAAFAGVAAVRRLAYRKRWQRPVELPVPVVVIGNISVGGTGKTPCIIWLARRLAERGVTVGIVSRGYGGRARGVQQATPDSDPEEVGDEPVLIAQRTACPVVVGRDRAAAAKALLAIAPVDVLLSDDGLQHYRLARHLEIAVVDGVRGLGNGLCLPAGPLREPPRRLRAADAIVVNGGDWGHAGVFRADLAPSRVYALASGEERSLELFRGQQVHAVAGIGHPERFFSMLEDADLEVIAHPLPDHARIVRADLEFADSAPVLITEKDAVKCRSIAPDNVWCVAVDLKFRQEDEARLMGVIMRTLDIESVS